MTTMNPAIKAQNDLIILELSKLQAAISIASDWVQSAQKNRDKVTDPAKSQFPGAVDADEAAYDAQYLAIGSTLLSHLQGDSSRTDSSHLVTKIRNTINLLN